ncbi:MAG: sigma-54 dependent transcriptional regulator [Terriglobales bacterium]|jgi:DNA-binding NtrC family response regulator
MTTFPVPPNCADHILVASPSSVVRERVLASLQTGARRVEQASGGAEALLHLEKGPWQVLFLDRSLPDLNAEELSETVRRRYPAIEVVLLDNGNEAAEGAAELAERWPKARCDDGGSEPLAALSGESEFDHRAGRDIDGLSAADSGAKLEPERPGKTSSSYDGRGHTAQSGARAGALALPGMIGSSAIMQPVYGMVHLVAPRDTTVLITGPTGSGKELVARALHQLSPRAAHALAVVNCAAIPESLLEAELFGYTRGAFTGAQQSYAGRIQAAHLGTLFLDEIGDMPISLQPKLLRFLEQKELQRLGSSQVVRVDVRVVAATNADLLALVREGKFREDLYYRLSAFPLAIPPLRERPEDVLQLAEHFLEKFSSAAAAPILSEEALGLLQAEAWRGNVRELQNVMERALILAGGQPVIRAAHLMLSGASGRRAASDRTLSSVPAMRGF